VISLTNFLNQSMQVSCDHSNTLIATKLGVNNSQFYRFLRLCSCKEFFDSQMVRLIVLKIEGHPLKILLERTRGLLNMEKFLLGISAFGVSQMILYKVFL
jgi:hypothetical protein